MDRVCMSGLFANSGFILGDPFQQHTQTQIIQYNTIHAHLYCNRCTEGHRELRLLLIGPNSTTGMLVNTKH